MKGSLLYLKLSFYKKRPIVLLDRLLIDLETLQWKRRAWYSFRYGKFDFIESTTRLTAAPTKLTDLDLLGSGLLAP